MADQDFDIIYKVILIGDSGVGKTNILSRYIRGEFSIETKSTVGVEYGSKDVKINDKTIRIQIWDTAGQERFKSITTTYFKGAKGAFVVYDITKKVTFNSIDKWIDELKNSGDPDVIILLVGNKSDLEEQRQIQQEEALKKSEQYKIGFCETSALQSVNIEKIFDIMIEEIYKKSLNSENVDDNNNDDKNKKIKLNDAKDIQISDEIQKKKKKKCCK